MIMILYCDQIIRDEYRMIQHEPILLRQTVQLVTFLIVLLIILYIEDTCTCNSISAMRDHIIQRQDHHVLFIVLLCMVDVLSTQYC